LGGKNSSPAQASAEGAAASTTTSRPGLWAAALATPHASMGPRISSVDVRTRNMGVEERKRAWTGASVKEPRVHAAAAAAAAASPRLWLARRRGGGD
jgi:hypothetical protein